MYGSCLVMGCLLLAQTNPARPENPQATGASPAAKAGDDQPAQRDEASTRGSLVTLQGEMSLAEALGRLRSQTGNKVVGAERYGDISVQASFQNRPYWEALDRLLDQAGLTINPYGGAAGALTLAARPEEQLPRCGRADYGGVFRVEAVLAETVRDLRLPSAQRLIVRLEISWEPRITPIALAQPLARVTATDERGNELPAEHPAAVCPALIRRDISTVELDLPLQRPDRSVKEIASLRGSLTAMLPSRIEAFEFSEIESARNVQQQKAAVTVTLEEVRKNVDVYEVRMRVRFDDAPEGGESRRGWVYNNEAYLLDPRGGRVDSAGATVTSQQGNEVSLSYQFVLDRAPKGYKFVYRTPVLIVQSHVAYEVKNIPLP